MTNYEVCIAFAQGRNAKSTNMESINGKLYSYSAVIAQRKGGWVTINKHRYSVTTSIHQSHALHAIKNYSSARIREVNDRRWSMWSL